MVRPAWTEVVRPPHRADIVGSNEIVVELQKSTISGEDIQAREAFYGDMVWLFDATFRFRMVCVGEVVFFALGRNKHIPLCKKPICLDFGNVVVEVIEFTGLFPECSGIGWRRDRSWFVSTYLSDVIHPEASFAVVRSDDKGSNPWDRKCGYVTMKHPTYWRNPDDGSTVKFPTGTPHISLGYRFSNPHGQWEDQEDLVIERYPWMANGWKKGEMNEMKMLLEARPVIFDGKLRMIPMNMEYHTNKMTVSATKYLLAKSEEHINAGRLPILQDKTKANLLRQAQEYEFREHGISPQKGDELRSLFDDK